MPRPKNSSVTVQMTDDPEDLDRLLAAATTPRQPKEPPHRQPDSPDLPDPAVEPSVPIPQREPHTPPPPDPARSPDAPTDEDQGSSDPSNHPAAASTAPSSPAPSPSPLASHPPLTYESRITIVDAWQYPGTLVHAPAWVDRNWAAYAADFDAMRQLEPGPALKVPTQTSAGNSYGQDKLCRVGDYVARQEVRLVADAPGEIRLEVWEKEQFERLFLPVTGDTKPIAA